MVKTESESRNERVLKLVEEAVAILLELRELLGVELDEPVPPPAVLDMVRAKLKRKECLQCGVTYKNSGGKRLCTACYAATKHQLDKRRSVTIAELVLRGLYKPRTLAAQVEKRRATALDLLLEEKAQLPPNDLPHPTAVAQEIVELARAKRPAKKSR